MPFRFAKSLLGFFMLVMASDGFGSCGPTRFRAVDPVKAPGLQISKSCDTATHLAVLQFRNVDKPAITFVWNNAAGRKRTATLGPGIWTGVKENVSDYFSCGCDGSSPSNMDITIESVQTASPEGAPPAALPASSVNP